MGGQVVSPDTRDLVARVEAIGWKFVGYDGSSHVVLANTNGARTSIPATPSDYRSLTNCLAMLERLAGRKLPRPKHRKSRKAARVEVDAEVEAARRKHAEAHAERLEAAHAARAAAREAEARRAADARATADADRRRREIEELMRP